MCRDTSQRQLPVWPSVTALDQLSAAKLPLGAGPLSGNQERGPSYLLPAFPFGMTSGHNMDAKLNAF